MPVPVGTPCYATANGIGSPSGSAAGYGNLIELNHGDGISTRYGHMSKLIVEPNQRVRRGQVIGLMGSTGRSTGSHLHSEVRIDGEAVNPVPFVKRSEEHTSALQSLMRISYAGFCLNKQTQNNH